MYMQKWNGKINLLHPLPRRFIKFLWCGFLMQYMVPPIIFSTSQRRRRDFKLFSLKQKKIREIESAKILIGLNLRTSCVYMCRGGNVEIACSKIVYYVHMYFKKTLFYSFRGLVLVQRWRSKSKNSNVKSKRPTWKNLKSIIGTNAVKNPDQQALTAFYLWTRAPITVVASIWFQPCLPKADFYPPII